jgi:hypothetical protein
MKCGLKVRHNERKESALLECLPRVRNHVNYAVCDFVWLCLQCGRCANGIVVIGVSFAQRGYSVDHQGQGRWKRRSLILIAPA